MPCSGNHAEFESAVETAATKAQEAMSEAEVAHRSALGLMNTAEQRELYLSAIENRAMRARLSAYAASLDASAKATLATAMDRKHDKEEKPSAEVAALHARLNEFIADRDEAEIAAVSPLASEIANSTATPAQSFEVLKTFTPSQIRAIHSMGLHSRHAQAAVAARAQVAPPARQGLGYGQQPQPAAAPGEMTEYAATIPSQGVGSEPPAETAGLVSDEWEVPQ